MSDAASVRPEPIRLVFELERADNPRLYDDLIRFKKGTKRVNRLRTLAQEGLLVERLPFGFTDAKPQTAPVDIGAASTIMQVFDQPLIE